MITKSLQMPSDPGWNQILKCGLIPTASLTISNKQIQMCKWLLIFEETLYLSQKLISNDHNWNLIRFKVQTPNKDYENSAASLFVPSDPTVLQIPVSSTKKKRLNQHTIIKHHLIRNQIKPYFFSHKNSSLIIRKH